MHLCIATIIDAEANPGRLLKNKRWKRTDFPSGRDLPACKFPRSELWRGRARKGEKSQREMLNLPITTSIFFPFPDDPPYPSSQFFFTCNLISSSQKIIFPAPAFLPPTGHLVLGKYQKKEAVTITASSLFAT